MVTINELKKSEEWKDEVEFKVLPASSELGQEAVARHGWKARHGLEIVRGNRAVGNLDGHNYGRDEIVALLGKHVP